MNPIDELKRMVSLIPNNERLFQKCDHIPSSTTPEPYKKMLVHEHHMTVTMENYHGCPVNVSVLDEVSHGDVYARQIILTRSDNGMPVQFGIVRFDFQYVTKQVREEIEAGQIPLGRVLITHNVLRHIDLGAILHIEAGPRLAEVMKMEEGAETYGRMATIFCNRRPAVDLLEITSPLD
ncbi:hypothetical protein KOR42_02520 [Thalassoglobus neptunius]|uniref:Uncharacterized protein n=1 Tax=Thalassoglobus neptunius TaxID=1938619 RepID=A0A5C5X1L3_9PLAN|nr:hypothetical protein [Thalassoglobus neptunius]TWT56897.1 hypothetical protein KOR42_02520 [Thalassoglobus neptunius]